MEIACQIGIMLLVIYLMCDKLEGKFWWKKENNIPIEFQDNIWEITLSVAAERDAYIYLCEGSDSRKDSACYWIILGGWAGIKDKGCAIRRCSTRKNCKGDKVIESVSTTTIYCFRVFVDVSF